MKHLTNSLQFKDIVLYIDRKNNQLTENFLKTIMRFVKSQSHLPNRFSYSGSEGDLSRVLTFKENLGFETLTANGECTTEFNLWNYIADSTTPYILKLFRQLPEKDTHIDNLEKDEVQITSLIKAFLKDSPIYILEKPEQYLNKEMIINTQQVIDHFSRVHKKIFIIKTESHSFWHSMANKILYRDENSNFILTPLPALQLLDNFDDFVEQESVHQEQDKLLTFKNIPKHLIAK